MIAENICFSKSNFVTLCGGEPLLVSELYDILELFKRNHKKIILNTNGELLPSCRYVYQYVDTVGVSIDGFNEETHRKMRGEKADYNKILNEVWYIKKYTNVKLKIGTILTRKNLPYIFDIAELVRNLRPNMWRIYQFSPRGKASNSEEEYAISLCDFEKTVGSMLKFFSTVSISGSSAIGTEGCFLIDECGYYIKPDKNSYIRYSSCLDEKIDIIWKRDRGFSTNVVKNKSWMNKNQC